MRIAELYSSIQGEGQFAGTPSVFVRTTECNLRCWFCDTPFTSWKPEGPQVSVDDLFRQVRAFEIEHVVLTGGETPAGPTASIEILDAETGVSNPVDARLHADRYGHRGELQADEIGRAHV